MHCYSKKKNEEAMVARANHLSAIEDSLQLMWQRELLRKGMKKESVLALERFTESSCCKKNPAKEQSTDIPIKRDARTALFIKQHSSIVCAII